MLHHPTGTSLPNVDLQLYKTELRLQTRMSTSPKFARNLSITTANDTNNETRPKSPSTPRYARTSSMVTVFGTYGTSPKTPSIQEIPQSTESTACCCCGWCYASTQTTTIQHVDMEYIPHRHRKSSCYTPRITHEHNTNQTLEWYDTLDDKCKMEAILAGHIQTMQVSSAAPIPVNAMTRQFHNVTIISKHSSTSSSCCEKCGCLAKWCQRATSKPQSSEEESPSRYRSPSPEPSCCGFVASKKPTETYA